VRETEREPLGNARVGEGAQSACRWGDMNNSTHRRRMAAERGQKNELQLECGMRMQCSGMGSVSEQGASDGCERAHCPVDTCDCATQRGSLFTAPLNAFHGSNLP